MRPAESTAATNVTAMAPYDRVGRRSGYVHYTSVPG